MVNFGRHIALALMLILGNAHVAFGADLHKEALRLMGGIQYVPGRPELNGPLLELRRLELLPGSSNPKLYSLDASLIEAPLGIALPPHLDEIRQLLVQEAVHGTHDLQRSWLGRVRQLLRAETRLRTTLPPEKGYDKLEQLQLAWLKALWNREGAPKLGKLKQDIDALKKDIDDRRQEVLRDLANEDLNFLLHIGTPEGGQAKDSLFAKSAVRFPPGLLPVLQNALPGVELKKDFNGNYPITALQARDLIGNRGLTPGQLVQVSQVISDNVRLRLPPQLQAMRDADSFLDVAQRRAAAEAPTQPAPQIVRFSNNAPMCPRGGGLSPALQPFLRQSPEDEEHQPNSSKEPTACFVDNTRPVNHIPADVNHDPSTRALHDAGGPDGFEMVMHTTEGEANNKVGECMTGIVHPSAVPSETPAQGPILFPPSPGHKRSFRMVLLTATHCLHGTLTGIELPGFTADGQQISAGSMDIQRIPNSDASMIYVDIPFETARLLSQASHRFVYPPAPDFNPVGKVVVQSPNLNADHSKLNLGGTFAVAGTDTTVGRNQFGLNFLHAGNQYVMEGDSGGPVETVVDGRKTWTGAMSYKCLNPLFQDSVGAAAGGPDVYAFINNHLHEAGTRTILNDNYLARHQPLEEMLHPELGHM